MRTMSPAAHRTADRFTARMFRGLWVPAMLSSLGWALSDMADAWWWGSGWAPWDLPPSV